MDDGFNPYVTWLGIEAATCPPDHYQLLGLPRFEPDVQRIAAAANRRIEQLKRSATVKQLALAKQVAREIAVARTCLASAEEKARYDEALRGGPSHCPTADVPGGLILPPRAYEDDHEPDDADGTEDEPLIGIPLKPDRTSMPAPPPMHVTERTMPSVKTEIDPPSSGIVFRDTERPLVQRRWYPFTIACTCVLVALAVIAVALWWPPANSPLNSALASAAPTEADSGETTTSSPPAAPDSRAEAPSSASPTSPPNASLTDDGDGFDLPEFTGGPLEMEPIGDDIPVMQEDTRPPASVESVPAMPSTAAEGDAENLKQVQGTLADAREALSEGAMPKGTELIDLADLEAVDDVAAKEVSRARTALHFIEGFWHAVDEGFRGLKAGDEIDWDGKQAIVVDRTADLLVVRTGGRTQRIRRDHVPPRAARLLAARWLKADDPNSPVFLAAFELVATDGDHAAARRAFESARSAGVEGIADLLAMLDELETTTP